MQSVNGAQFLNATTLPLLSAAGATTGLIDVVHLTGISASL